MGLDTKQYYAHLGLMRHEACSIDTAGVRKTKTAPDPYRHTIGDFSEYGLVSLFFTMPNFYLIGVSRENPAQLYTFHNSSFNLMPYQSVRLPFGESYQNMGWTKNQATITVTIDDLNQAFYDLLAGHPSKEGFRSIVIAFAEGFRFHEIARKVAEGVPIGGKELDWSAPGATVQQGA